MAMVGVGGKEGPLPRFNRAHTLLQWKVLRAGVRAALARGHLVSSLLLWFSQNWPCISEKLTHFISSPLLLNSSVVEEMGNIELFVFP